MYAPPGWFGARCSTYSNENVSMPVTELEPAPAPVPEDVAILKELVAVVDEADRLRVLHAEIGDRVGELRNGTGRVLPFPTT